MQALGFPASATRLDVQDYTVQTRLAVAGPLQRIVRPKRLRKVEEVEDS